MRDIERDGSAMVLGDAPGEIEAASRGSTIER
jgi:hypothetical protein